MAATKLGQISAQTPPLGDVWLYEHKGYEGASYAIKLSEYTD
jgi:hypothetical protein